jgi:hypothetical protein
VTASAPNAARVQASVCDVRSQQAGLRLALLAIVVCGSQSGCVTRRLTIISDPPGATVYVDREEVGVTPCSVSYIYYGTRQIELVKDGYETRTVLQEMPAPWYEYFPIEFVTENFIPWELRDERTVEYKLLPQPLTPASQLLGRGEELRQGVQFQRQQAPPPPPLGAPPFGAPPLPTPAPGAPTFPRIDLGKRRVGGVI